MAALGYLPCRNAMALIASAPLVTTPAGPMGMSAWFMSAPMAAILGSGLFFAE